MTSNKRRSNKLSEGSFEVIRHHNVAKAFTLKGHLIAVLSLQLI